MSPAHLSLVTDETPRETGQLLLRPVVRFVDVAIGAPYSVRRACRRKSVRRTRQAAAPPQSTPDLIPYGPYRPLVVEAPPAPPPAPLRLVPTSRLHHPRKGKRVELAVGGKRSMGPGAMTEAEYLELNDIEHALTAEGLLPWRDESCAEILAGDHPCYRAACRHNTRIEVRRAGEANVVCLNHPGKEVDEIPETCSIRYARNNPDGATQEEVAEVLGCAGQRVQQIENAAIRKFKATEIGREWMTTMFAARFRENG